MNTPRYLIKTAILSSLIILGASCGASNDVQERRNLMMPKLSDNPRNSSKYKERDYSNRNKAIDRKLRRKQRRANRRNSR